MIQHLGFKFDSWSGEDIDSRTVYIRNTYGQYEKKNMVFFPPIPLKILFFMSVVLFIFTIWLKFRRNKY